MLYAAAATLSRQPRIDPLVVVDHAMIRLTLKHEVIVDLRVVRGERGSGFFLL